MIENNKNRNLFKMNKYNLYYYILILISLLITGYYILIENGLTIKIFLLLSFFIGLLYFLKQKVNFIFILFSFVFFLLQSVSINNDLISWSFLFGPDLQIYFSLPDFYNLSFNFLVLNYEISFIYKKVFLEKFIAFNLLHLIMSIYYFNQLCSPRSRTK